MKRSTSINLIITCILLIIPGVRSQDKFDYHWRHWKGQIPPTMSCANGTLKWEQISTARMVIPSKEWSDFKTTAEVHLTLTRPDNSVIKENGIARNNGVLSSVTGKRISAGVGTQSLTLKLDENILCENWKFHKPNVFTY
ncbi:MAG: hypothetical protein JJ844_01215 [Prochlorococcus marinus CUG1435]|nr:hypothetical protein [Prochlorococcus marinus CUG1435]